jgi:hypothetical protein
MNRLTVQPFKALSLGAVGATIVSLGMAAAPALAATVFTDEAAFLSNVQGGSYLETFDSLAVGSNIGTSLNFSGNGFSYEATAINPDPSLNEFFNAASAGDVWLSTFAANTPIVFNFTSGNVSAISGAFFPNDVNGAVTPGSVSLTLSDGTSQTLTNTNDTSFIGFLANPGTVFTSLTISSDQPFVPGYFPTVNNLRVGTAATPIPTPALLPGLIGMGVAVWRKRKAEAVKG